LERAAPRRRPFGSTDLQVSEIGFGCSSLGTVLGHDADQDGLRALDFALDHDINFFDTADAYSLGNSERLLGRAFKKKRDRVIIATKGGSRFTPGWRFALQSIPFLAPLRRPLRPFKRFFNLLRHSQKQYDYSDRQLRTAVEASLAHLQTDYVDLYQLYNPTHPVLEAGDFIGTLELLKSQGKIRYYGVSCRTHEDALLCLKYPGISSLQLPVSMVEQAAIPSVIPSLAQRSVAVIAREPLAQGLLTGASGRTLAEESARSLAEIHERKRRSADFSVFAAPGRSMAQSAMQFVLRVSGVSTVIPGIANVRQLEENLGALTAPQLSEQEFARIRSMGASSTNMRSA